MILSINNKALQGPYRQTNFPHKGIHLHAPAHVLCSCLTTDAATLHGYKFIRQRISYGGSCNGIQKDTHMRDEWGIFIS